MAEKEYIERGALLKRMFPIGMPNNGAYPINAKAVRTAIEQVPAADVVEVVRCANCDFCDNTMRCQCDNSCMGLIREDNDFCSYGERKGQK